MTQMNLGNALKILGERETGTARLDQAVEAFSEALKEYTREKAPMDWAMTQMNLGIALATLGARETGTVRLDQAVEAFSEALKENAREKVPMEWAMTQHCMSGVEISYFDKTQDATRLDAAFSCAQAARAVYVDAQAEHYIRWIDNQYLPAIQSRRDKSGDGPPPA